MKHAIRLLRFGFNAGNLVNRVLRVAFVMAVWCQAATFCTAPCRLGQGGLLDLDPGARERRDSGRVVLFSQGVYRSRPHSCSSDDCGGRRVRVVCQRSEDWHRAVLSRS